MPYPRLLHALADAILAGEPTVDRIVAGCAARLGRPWRWLRPLAQRYLAAMPHATRPRRREVIQFLRADRGVRRAHRLYGEQIQFATALRDASRMNGAAMAAAWNLPVIETSGDLADWLALLPGELDWFADLKALGYKGSNPRLRHYRYRILSKGDGNVRLIEAPKPRLKYIQQRILSGILDRVPPHPAAHGFIKGRSVRSFATPHVGQRVVLRMDLRDFFPSIHGVRVQTLFRALGYPETVADLLGGICSNAAPRDIWAGSGASRETRLLYAAPHLPQGAPTSPALANLCLYRADCRLLGLAASAGAQYTRYADDLAFSGGNEFDRRVERFVAHAAAILHEEGFAVHHRKTRIMRQGVRQHLAGLVANQRLNVGRDEFDRLKATLTNCLRHRPASQNRENHPDFRAHLEGRVNYVESINPAKGARLRVILEKISWDRDAPE
jgi:hypothetical protein